MPVALSRAQHRATRAPLRTCGKGNPWPPLMATPVPAPMIASSTASDDKEAIMRWLASNWLFILLVVGMAGMHLGHGGHGGGHQASR